MGRSSKEIDWESVERDYRIGQLTIRQIAEKHDVATSAITRRAKKNGWARDLSDAVRLATKAKVRAAVVEEAHKRDTGEAQATFSEVDLAANVNATIIVNHQRRAGRLGGLLEKMLGELEEVTSKPLVLEEIVQAMGDDDPFAVDAIKQLRSVKSRMETLKVASEINIKVQDSERKSFNIDDDKGGNKGNGIEDVIKRIDEAVSNGGS